MPCLRAILDWIFGKKDRTPSSPQHTASNRYNLLQPSNSYSFAATNTYSSPTCSPSSHNYSTTTTSNTSSSNLPDPRTFQLFKENSTPKVFKSPSTNSFAPIQLRIDPIRVQKSTKPVDHAVLEDFKPKVPVVFNPSTTSLAPIQLRIDPIRVQKSPKPVDHTVPEDFKAKTPPVVFNPSTTPFATPQLRIEPIRVQKSEDFKAKTPKVCNPSTTSLAPIQLRVEPITVQKSTNVVYVVPEDFKAKTPPVVFNPSSSSSSAPAQLRTDPIWVQKSHNRVYVVPEDFKAKTPPVVFNPSTSLATPQLRTKPVRVQKSTSPIYAVPEDIKDLIKRNLVPQVLRKPLSSSTYNDYFATLLYAEDYYIEKWSKFTLSNVTVDFREATIYEKWGKGKGKGKAKQSIKTDEGKVKLFVAFKIDLIKEKRPFLLSRDFVFLRPSDKSIEPFQGILYRVQNGGTLILAKFGKDFHSQHYSSRKYDVSFSFNRVCLKRSHQAVSTTIGPLLQKFLFPSAEPSFPYFQVPGTEHASAIRNISGLKGLPPYLIEGPPSVTALLVKEVILNIYRTSPGCRILVSSPTNDTCDVIMKSLKSGVPDSVMFRANAAFRDFEDVPDDILSSCTYKGECFTCPSLEELKNFKVIISTFVSSFRLHKKGISAGHFSHIFLVDASSAIEPESMVVLANLVDENTVVVITGNRMNSPRWIRSDIGRNHGLKTSYFQRLFESEVYRNLHPTLVTCIKD
ncbi:hypothetical protein GIB67_035576 [Kingdonia uniflora]|uniref:Helicase MOV-10-like beta-barrel domain-containing protein n=1 Tax=Kingdonia uniflora TaxID=39325 RepID=A0A7J7LDC0_9MAGN|nr:hypothetical protein GIB67_035576 [Kingdonia uniflora]